VIQKRYRLPGLILLLAFQTSSLPANSDGEEDVLELCRIGNCVSLQSIHTISCRAKVTHTAPDQLSITGEYWRSLDSVRSKWKKNHTSYDYLLRDSVIKALTKGRSPDGRERIVASITRATGQRLGECDVWNLALMTVASSQEGAVLTFDELLTKPYTLHRVERQENGHRQLILVDLSFERAHLEIWFDPQINYLVRKEIVTVPLGRGKLLKQLRQENQVTQVKEVLPGIFFPEKMESQVYVDNQLVSTQLATFSDIRVNHPLPADTFQLRFPRGVQLVNQIQGKEYKSDENGDSIGSSRPLASIPPLVSSGNDQEVTEDEQKPLATWILLASVGILVIAGCLWLYRKRRRPVAVAT